MNKLSQAIALATAMTAGLATAVTTHANDDIEFNAAVTSNYVWRGDAQGNDNTALQGGADYSHKSGASAGIWTSSLEGDTEVDYYAAFGGEAGDFSYSVGAILYDYNNDDADFSEVNASVGLMGASLTYNRKIDDNDDDKGTDDASYVSLAYGLNLAEDIGLDLAYGHTFDVDDSDSDSDKYDVLVSLTKSLPDFDFSLTATDKEDGENEFFITVAKTF